MRYSPAHRLRPADWAPEPGESAVFAADEPVLTGRPLLPGVEVPCFGRMDRWPIHALRRPANIAPSAWVAVFDNVQVEWNLRARELVMAVLNPGHRALERVGVVLDRPPYEPGTIIGMLSELRILLDWVAAEGMDLRPGTWTSLQMRRYIADKARIRAPATVRNYVSTIRLLHELAPALTGGGLAEDPWPGLSARQAANNPPTDELSTRNISPEVWFPLVKAAWRYIDVFAADIFAARAIHETLTNPSHDSHETLTAHLRRWLEDPAHLIPVHHSGSGPDGNANWRLPAQLLGRGRENAFTGCGGAGGKAVANAAIAAGRARPGTLLDQITDVERPDGTRGPWHKGLDPTALGRECRALRAACFVLVAATSMMRDSEIREIVRGSLVAEYYGAPAVTSRKRKLDPGRPVEHWWITQPVAQAIVVAEELSRHPELVFADPGLPPGLSECGKNYEHSISRLLIKAFIEYVNAHAQDTGLAPIPAEKVAPHQFRKTMAMLVGTQPGSEIALGLQLKHAATRALANRSTQSYAATDSSWAGMLDTSIESARFQRLCDMYDQHKAGQVIGYGPGAERLTALFDTVGTTAADTRQAKTAGARTEYDLLRNSRVHLRFGKLNHCTFDPARPEGAKCLTDATRPPGHTEPLIDRCQPGRCPNSVITEEHLDLWRAEETSLLALIDTPKIAPCRREALVRQLDDVRSVIRKAET
jgi:hypothetical protein